MTTEELIEVFISEGVDAYKKNSGDCLEARKLNRHEPVIVDGHEFRYWREYAVYRMAEYIGEIIGDSVEVELNGNDSTIKVELDDAQQKKLNREMFLFLRKINGLKNL